MMSEEEFLRLMHEHDHPKGSFWSHLFSGRTAEREFKAFASSLSARIGQSVAVHSGRAIQDASFFAEIDFAPHYGRLRFSYSGKMIALTPDHEIPTSISVAIDTLANELGYTVIPTTLLDTPYTGVERRGLENWWERYFDYGVSP